MSTRVVNRYGEPYETRQVRQRMGFLRDELGESGEPVTFTQPSGFTMPATERTSEGEGEPPIARSPLARIVSRRSSLTVRGLSGVD